MPPDKSFHSQFDAGLAVRHGDGSGGWTTRSVTGIPALGTGDLSNAGQILFAWNLYKTWTGPKKPYDYRVDLAVAEGA